MTKETDIINPHWDKVLRKKHQISDEGLETIKALLYDSEMNMLSVMEENMSLKETISNIRIKLKKI